MSWDAEALIRQIQESERTVAGAMNEIMLLRERIHDLEIENQRLRDRLTRSNERIRRMEQGEL